KWTCCSFEEVERRTEAAGEAARGPKGRRGGRRAAQRRLPGSDPSRSRATWPKQVRCSAPVRQMWRLSGSFLERPPTTVLAASAGGAPEQAAAEAKEPRDPSGRGAFFMVREVVWSRSRRSW